MLCRKRYSQDTDDRTTPQVTVGASSAYISQTVFLTKGLGSLHCYGLVSVPHASEEGGFIKASVTDKPINVGRSAQRLDDGFHHLALPVALHDGVHRRSR